MNKKENQLFGDQGRRSFIKKSTLAASGAMVSPLWMQGSHFLGVDRTIKVALIGCGGRGTGACVQALSTDHNVELVAMADVFSDQLEKSLRNMAAALKEEGKEGRIKVKDSHKFVGFEGYKKAIPLADVVILTTPPGFRPLHFEEAVKQEKHVFMEKPVATDPAGVKKVLEAAEIAKQKKLNVVVGLQRRFQTSYRELIHRIHDGIIGDITSAQAWWNGGGVWVHPRKPQWNEMEYQMRNWFYFNWLCGDHIVEQHVHNIDVVNWAMDGFPVKAQGMGGREVRKGPEHGQIFDHHFVEFEYENGTLLNSQCRHTKGAFSKVDELIVGTKGKVYFNAGRIEDLSGKLLYKFDKSKENEPYQNEHDELFAAIANNEFKFSNAEYGAKSTMTGIMGRMATYSGEMIDWDKALDIDLGYDTEKFVSLQDIPPVLPKENGHYPVPVPGITKFMNV